MKSRSDNELVRIAVAVVLERDAVLVGQRGAGSVLGGMSEFPGGKCLADESFSSAAVRECLEETGMVVETRELICEVEHDYDYGRLRLSFWHCQAAHASLNPPQPPFRWVPITLLPKLTFPPANAEALSWLSSLTSRRNQF